MMKEEHKQDVRLFYEGTRYDKAEEKIKGEETAHGAVKARKKSSELMYFSSFTFARATFFYSIVKKTK